MMVIIIFISRMPIKWQKALRKTAPAYRPQRVFLDDYPQENTSNGQKAPVVNQLINQAMADGQLIINYSGHGGILGLADEQIVTLQDILSWKNRRLPLFVTATCQFGRYDDPNVNSGAELNLIEPDRWCCWLVDNYPPGICQYKSVAESGLL